MSRGLTNQQADRVIAAVAARHGLTAVAIKGTGRGRTLSAARREIWRELVHTLGASMVEAGLATGHDHTSVLYGLRKLSAA